MNDRKEYYILNSLGTTAKSRKIQKTLPDILAQTGYELKDLAKSLRMLKEQYLCNTDNLYWWITPDGEIRKKELENKIGYRALWG